MKAIPSIKEIAKKQAANTNSGPGGESVKKALSRSQLRENQRWSFSFRFFQEMKNFGLDSGQVSKKWTLSVIYRLQELSKLTVAAVTEDRDLMDGTLRIHNINWNQKNIPIKREDLTSIDADYLQNPVEFPIMQIAVSKAEGRLIGFFDEDNSFQIVLLDPLHNAQPSKFNGYKVSLCGPLGCEMTAIRHAARKAVNKIQGRECACAQELESSLGWLKNTPSTALVIPSDDGKIVQDADALIEMGGAKGYADIVEAGIDRLMSEHLG